MGLWKTSRMPLSDGWMRSRVTRVDPYREDEADALLASSYSAVLGSQPERLARNGTS